MKSCGRCRKLKAFECFGKASKATDGLHWWCKECLSVYAREKRLENPGKRREIFKKSRDRTCRQKRDYVREEKRRPCADCGIQYETWVMQFDHLPGKSKSFNLARAFLKSLDEIKEEIGKCEVVCANCHSQRTHNRKFTGPG